MMVAEPLAVVDGEFGECLLAGEELFRQRRTLVREVVFFTQYGDLTVEISVTQGFCDLCAREPAADDHESPVGAHY